jgi:hypothetical protein
MTITDAVWGVLWRSRNKLDGIGHALIWHDGELRLFYTRANARAWIEENYGYIRERADLRAEPHGWQMPIPIRVQLAYKEKA